MGFPPLRPFSKDFISSLNFFQKKIEKSQIFYFFLLFFQPEINNSIKMEVGIEDCLHIEFEYNRSKYHLKDVVIGKIYFLLV